MESDIIQATEIHFNYHNMGISYGENFDIVYDIAEHEKAVEMIVKYKKHIDIYLTEVELYKYAALFDTDNNLLIMYCDFTNFSSSLEHAVLMCIININDINICFNNPERLINLNSLHISCNLLTFPEQITKITSLKYLAITRGSLSELPDSFVNLTKLEELDLSHNNFTTIPEVLGYLDIKYLYFNSNPIKIIPDFVCNINVLYVRNTKIKILPKNIQSNVVCDGSPLSRKFVKHWRSGVDYANFEYEVVKFSNMLHLVNYTIAYLAIVHNVPLDVVSCIARCMIA